MFVACNASSIQGKGIQPNAGYAPFYGSSCQHITMVSFQMLPLIRWLPRLTCLSCIACVTFKTSFHYHHYIHYIHCIHCILSLSLWFHTRTPLSRGRCDGLRYCQSPAGWRGGRKISGHFQAAIGDRIQSFNECFPFRLKCRCTRAVLSKQPIIHEMALTIIHPVSAAMDLLSMYIR